MNLRERIKTATAQIHQELHGAAPFASIAEGSIERPAYVELLLFLSRYHGMMEGACAAGAAWLEAPSLAAAHRARLRALRADLLFFGRGPGSVIGAAPRDGDFAVGCLYTVMGSSLGGRLIHRQLETLLPDGQGRSFFKGGDDGADWQLLCRRLDDALLDPERVEAGALHAFRQFQMMLVDSGKAAACA